MRPGNKPFLALDVDHQPGSVEGGHQPFDRCSFLQRLAQAPPDQRLLGPADRQLQLARALVLAQDHKLARVAGLDEVGCALDAGDGELAGGAEGRGLGAQLDVDALAVDAVLVVRREGRGEEVSV